MKYHQCNSEAELFEIKYAHHRSRCVLWKRECVRIPVNEFLLPSQSFMKSFAGAGSCGRDGASLSDGKSHECELENL
jgi:hypothetical protein